MIGSLIANKYISSSIFIINWFIIWMFVWIWLCLDDDLVKLIYMYVIIDISYYIKNENEQS